MNKPLLILVSKPYMSGTNGEEGAIAANLKEKSFLLILQKFLL